jgi:hypothetical protein
MSINDRTILDLVGAFQKYKSSLQKKLSLAEVERLVKDAEAKAKAVPGTPGTTSPTPGR